MSWNLVGPSFSASQTSQDYCCQDIIDTRGCCNLLWEEKWGINVYIRLHMRFLKQQKACLLCEITVQRQNLPDSAKLYKGGWSWLLITCFTTVFFLCNHNILDYIRFDLDTLWRSLLFSVWGEVDSVTFQHLVWLLWEKTKTLCSSWGEVLSTPHTFQAQLPHLPQQRSCALNCRQRV